MFPINRAQRGGPRFLHCGQFWEEPQEGQGQWLGQIFAGQRQGLWEITLQHAAQLVDRAGALIRRAAAGCNQHGQFRVAGVSNVSGWSWSRCMRNSARIATASGPTSFAPDGVKALRKRALVAGCTRYTVSHGCSSSACKSALRPASTASATARPPQVSRSCSSQACSASAVASTTPRSQCTRPVFRTPLCPPWLLRGKADDVAKLGNCWRGQHKSGVVDRGEEFFGCGDAQRILNSAKCSCWSSRRGIVVPDISSPSSERRFASVESTASRVIVM